MTVKKIDTSMLKGPNKAPLNIPVTKKVAETPVSNEISTQADIDKLFKDNPDNEQEPVITPNTTSIVHDNFNWATLGKSKARKYNKSAVSMVMILKSIDPGIETLEVGKTLQIEVKPNDEQKLLKHPARGFLMGIMGKISSVTSKGEDWEGRHYVGKLDPNNEFAYIGRFPDLPKEMIKDSATRGRRKGVPNKPKDNINATPTHVDMPANTMITAGDVLKVIPKAYLL